MPIKYKKDGFEYEGFGRNRTQKAKKYYIKQLSKESLFEMINSDRTKPKHRIKYINEIARRGITLVYKMKDGTLHTGKTHTKNSSRATLQKDTTIISTARGRAFLKHTLIIMLCSVHQHGPDYSVDVFVCTLLVSFRSFTTDFFASCTLWPLDGPATMTPS